MPEFALPLPELPADLDFTFPVPQLRASGDSQSLSLTPLNSQQGPDTPEGPLGGLVIPSSSTVRGGEFRIEGIPDSVGGPSDMLGGDEMPQALEEEFSFDADGNFIDLAGGEEIAATPANRQGGTMPSDVGASARVRREHEEGQVAGAEVSLPLIYSEVCTFTTPTRL